MSLRLDTSRRQLMLGGTALAATVATPATARVLQDKAGGVRADAVAQRLLATSPAPALSVAVARSNGLVWAKAYGKADLQLDVATTPAHRFGLGSISKILTAAAAARLATRGVIDLDEPITRWLPDLPAQHRQTTLRQLFTHRGGIRHYDLAHDFGAKAPGGPIGQRAYPSNRQILDIFINDPLVGPPGAKVAYSSFGYSLASIVMETAARQPFLELLKAEVTVPFGLSSLEGDYPFTASAGTPRTSRPRPGRSRRRQAAAVAVHDVLDDGQAQARARSARRSSGLRRGRSARSGAAGARGPGPAPCR
jgi:CubicO group peptidase (beta-lactamase class C family)